MEILQSTLQVNAFARRNRHLKIFSRADILKHYGVSLVSGLISPFIGFVKKPIFIGAANFLTSFKGILSSVAPQKKLLIGAMSIGMATLLLTSVGARANLATASVSYADDYIASYGVPGEMLMSDDGYLVKINSQTEQLNSRIGLTDHASHTVESGESLSKISQDYGVKVETIMWANNLSNANSLKVGQALTIPSVDGISYKVAAGDNVEKIAKKYKISSEAVIAQNRLSTNSLVAGQSLILPGARPIAAPGVIGNAKTPAAVGRTASATRSASRVTTAADSVASSSAPSVGKIFIFPTTGQVSQGYHAGHYALDIADRSMPPIWAAGAGTVIKSSTGTWGGGYGNHVIIDHGNGIQTLYAHMSSVSVSEGQEVNQGDVLGIMGNTGRVYGATGIHLHWEVRDNGVKQYPANYY